MCKQPECLEPKTCNRRANRPDLGTFGPSWRAAFLLIIPLFFVASSTAAPVAPRSSSPTSPGYWLLELAWNQAGNLATSPTRTDAAELVCILQAATRLDPKLAEAWYQQYDLLKGLGRQQEAVQALARYTELTPDDEPALMTLAGEQIAAGQTAEQRMATCETWLARPDLPPAVTAFVLRASAEIHGNRLQNQQALQDIQRAVAVFPYDIAAQRLLLDMQPSTDLADDLNLNLWILRANPADAGTMMDVGRIADGLGLYDDAAGWYDRAKAVMTRLNQNTSGLTLQTADHWLAAGQPTRAVEILQSLRTQRYGAEAQLLLAEAYFMLGETAKARDAATKALRTAATQPTTATAPATGASPAQVHSAAITVAQDYCQNAWIRMIYLDAAEDPSATKTAFEAATDQSWARRCYGWALLKAKQFDDAIEILQPISQVDAWAALGLAQAYNARGDAQRAKESLAAVQRISATGPAYRAAVRWAATAGLSLPALQPAVRSRAQALLRQFDRTLLDLPLQPDKFLKLKLVMDAPPAPGKGWFGKIELTNTGDAPIYCGPYGSFVPNVLVSAMVYDPGSRDIGQRLLVRLQRQFVLRPGQTVSVYRPLDSGPLHNLLVNPNADVQVMFTATLDPVRTGAGKWIPGPLGLATEPLSARRGASQPPREDSLLHLAKGGTHEQKIDVARWIGCIVAGKQSKTGPQTQPALTPQSPLTQALVTLLADSDTLVVARTLSDPAHTPLIEPVFQAAMPHVNDADWLTRLMAVRFFAHQQGAKFTRALKSLSRSDPDPVVRSLMAAYYADFVAGDGK